ncbi:hypothetical protein QJS10_CPA09g00298 [Acorus calamus]|uniref:Protein NRDE2 homolog n=1 Tax=Acorus calamus TaxID=4465 RepID=A0AAV9E6Q0_ACOCL|nr:hypothetical protein QJS10_CPA09g00298 [Acorus calamus]
MTSHRSPLRHKPPSYRLIDSSRSSSSGDDDERRSKKKRKKRRRRERFEDVSGGVSRKSGVRAWTGSVTKPAKDYYIDVRGDRDNLVFGSLYRMDIARYKPHNLTASMEHHIQFLYRWKSRGQHLDVDGDIDALDSNSRNAVRYCSSKYSSLEKHKGFKHLHVAASEKSSIVPGEFIALTEPVTTLHEEGRKGDLEESWEDEIINKTREFNKKSWNSPHDEKVWLAFAEFQDKIAGMQPQKAARLQTLEKKISILEKATELNPDSENLLLCLLKSYQSRDSTDVLVDRWEKILRQHPGSCNLWKEFLRVRQGEFSSFKVSDMRKAYAHAMQALASTCSRLCRQGRESVHVQTIDPDLINLELGLVDIFVSLCKFEWQTGYQEVATGLFQAEIEYSLFCPSLLLSMQNKHRLFEHFWNSNGVRIGEDEAMGWAIWLEKEEENRQNIFTEDLPQDSDVGGWTGWVEPPSGASKINTQSEEIVEDADDEEMEEDDHDSENKSEKDVELLLKKLGINVDPEALVEVKDTETWKRWSKEELSRDCEQWMPVRENSGPSNDENPDAESNEGLSRLIVFEDVCDYLFSLCSEEARFYLVSRFIDFFGGKISRWTCSNSSSWTESILSVDMLQASIVEQLRKVFEVTNRTQSMTDNFSLISYVDSSVDVSKMNSIMKFLRNAILLFLRVFPRSYILEEAVLFAEELYVAQMNSSSLVNPSRALAKSLLKSDRQDLLLCGLYARSEAASGNIDLARKVFDMALTSMEGIPVALRENAPMLYFWYAEMELANCSCENSNELSSQRAIHILSCLGGCVKYTSYQNQTSGLQLLRARQGFKDQMKGIKSAWARGDIKDQSIALICSASLFEILTLGWAAGIGVIEEAFSMVLPERRSQSSQLESLLIHSIRILQKHLKDGNLPKMWEHLLQGLQIYPYNPDLFVSMVEVGHRYTVLHKLRLIFDQYCQKKPSVITWLFALSFELGKPDSQHRIHGLFERALSNDRLQKSVILWRCYLAYEIHVACNPSAARRVFFRAIHACPWSKRLWLDGFQQLNSILSAKELSDLQEVMRDKELHLRTDIYEILLQDEIAT